MKLAVVALACMVACAHAQFNRASAFASFNNNNNNRNVYRAPQPFRAVTAAPRYNPYVAAPAPVAQLAAVAQAGAVPVAARYGGSEAAANILKIGSEVNPDGTFNYFYETDNGIAAQAQGEPRSLGGNPPAVADVVQGSFSWTSPEGKVISISYVADENGYYPQGDAIPTSPPVPPQIARALEYIARNAKPQQ